MRECVYNNTLVTELKEVGYHIQFINKLNIIYCSLSQTKQKCMNMW